MSKLMPLLMAIYATQIVGCPGTNSSSIAAVLAQDARTTDSADSVAQVVQRMRAIDLGKCATDFREAYIVHIHAWERFALLERDAEQYQANYNSGGAMLESFLRGMMGDIFGKSQEALADHRYLQQRYQQCTHDLQTTFQNVERIASRYGVSTPKD